MLGLIVGSAAGQRKDMEMFSRTFHIPEHRTICVNWSCTVHCDECVSQHEKIFPNHVSVRNEIPTKYFRGTSGLHACWYALAKAGLRKIVLIGIPLSDPYNHQHTMECWREFHKDFGKRTRSFSFDNGNDSFTIKLFGKPTQEWLNG